jgi:hypothetical protein
VLSLKEALKSKGTRLQIEGVKVIWGGCISLHFLYDTGLIDCPKLREAGEKENQSGKLCLETTIRDLVCIEKDQPVAQTLFDPLLDSMTKS